MPAMRLSAMTIRRGAGSAALVDVGAEALAIDCGRRTPGAVSPVTRNAARNVLVASRPPGAWSWPRGHGPAVPPKQIVGAAGFAHEVGDIPGAPPRATRSAGVRPIVFGSRTVFFSGRARTARQTSAHSRAWQGAAQPASMCDDQAAACRCGSSMERRPSLDARRQNARFAACFSSRTHDRSRGTSRPHRPPSSRHRCRVAPTLADHRHASVCIRVDRNPAPGSTRPIEKR